MNQRQLRECAAELNRQIGKIACISHISVLFGHFSQTKKDAWRSSTDRNMYNGSLKHISCGQFIFDLAIMYDALSFFLRLCWNKVTTVVYVDILIRRSFRFTEYIKEKAETRVLDAQVAINEGIIANNSKQWLLRTISSHESTRNSDNNNPGVYQKFPNEMKLIPLINCTKLIPYSSAECERGFSHRVFNQAMAIDFTCLCAYVFKT
ncbi:hypothetical protein PR048_000546 [Dryococelus australis]|uniref:HAT C-terminal dimerisation domain-containing protein n=1 Tax=Dryococelus australis TaxID=614101 RepID=A0ABQ9IFV8_9NEOP|nr:hypothetical protein PR048_000546 [Dryococelus australis]